MLQNTRKSLNFRFGEIRLRTFSRNHGPPMETLRTKFHKLQTTPLEVGDHLIGR